MELDNCRYPARPWTEGRVFRWWRMRQHLLAPGPEKPSLLTFADEAAAEIKRMRRTRSPGQYDYRHGVRCAVCGDYVLLLTKAHLRKHGLSKLQYLALFPHHRKAGAWGVART